MAKMSNKTTALKPKVATATKLGSGPMKTKKKATTVTYEGAPAYKLGDKTALFNLAVVNMVGEDKFYESAQVSDDRFVKLLHTVTKGDPDWVAAFIPYLRNEMYMRTASVVAAAEYVAAGGPNGRSVINSALQRADEPAEFLAYWMSRYYGWEGEFPLPAPKLPQAVRKGLADAVRRLYTEYSVMKYNGLSRGIAMGNVLNLIHPTPKDSSQGDLFQYIIDRHHSNEKEVPSSLDKINNYTSLNRLQSENREKLLSVQVVKDAGLTWESLSAWGPMDARKWEMVIPSMGYMALLRNLRNFEQAGISKDSVKFVNDKLTNPEEVAKSKQFPFRFLSAYKNTASLLWASALEEALDLSVQNIPSFEGGSQIYVDVSGSMTNRLSAKSSIQLWEVGALFGAACFYKFGEETEVFAFGTTSKLINLAKGGSVLKGIQQINDQSVGWGTNLGLAVDQHYSGQERVVIFSDMQTQQQIKKKVKTIHAFNLGGYDRSPFEIGKNGVHGYGGFTDKTFTLMKILEDTGSGGWPFIS